LECRTAELRQAHHTPVGGTDRAARQALAPDDRVMIMAPMLRGRKGEFKKRWRNSSSTALAAPVSMANW